MKIVIAFLALLVTSPLLASQHVFIGTINDPNITFVDNYPVVSVDIDSALATDYQNNVAYIALPFSGSPIIERIIEERTESYAFFFSDLSYSNGIAIYKNLLEVKPMRNLTKVVNWYQSHLVQLLKQSVSSDLRSLNRRHQFPLRVEYDLDGDRKPLPDLSEEEGRDSQLDVVYLSNIVKLFPMRSELLAGSTIKEKIVFKPSKKNHYDSKVESILAKWQAESEEKEKANE